MDQEEERRQADTTRRLGALVSATAARLRDAGAKREAIVSVIRRFLDEGQAIVYHPSLLWGLFEDALDKAGYGAWALDRRLRIYSTVSHELFGEGEPLPDDWPRFEKGKKRKAERS